MGLAEELAEKYLRAAGSDRELSLHGCCDYEETWRPGIKDWGATDEESFNLAEIRVPSCRDMIAAAINEAFELAAQEAEKVAATWGEDLRGSAEMAADRIRALEGGS